MAGKSNEVNKIVEREGEFCVISEDGTRSFGCYVDRSAAERRLEQIEGFKGNSLLVNFNMQVNRDMIRREVRGGDEFVIIRSATLPDNVIMNGGLYPAGEIEAGYRTLEGTLAPLGHPQDADGSYIPAASQYAIDNYYVGAANENVRRDSNRVFLDKAINVRVANGTDRGKRLMDRIKALEEGNGAPIHTSTGVFLRQLHEPGMTHNGDKYDWVATEMRFDHDAILLDEPGAATPDQGVGIAVNSKGDLFKVVNEMIEPIGNAKSLNQLREIMDRAVRDKFDTGRDEYIYVEDVFSDHVIYCKMDKAFRVDYTMDGDTVEFTSEPIEVRREVDYKPISVINRLLSILGFAQEVKPAYNSESKYLQTPNSGVDPMKEKMIKRLKEANLYKEDMDDDAMMNAYDKMMKGEEKPKGNADELAAVVTNALAPLVERIEAMESEKKAERESQKSEHVTAVVNSGLLDEETAKAMPAEALAKLAANCHQGGGAQFLSTAFAGNAADKEFSDEMPD